MYYFHRKKLTEMLKLEQNRSLDAELQNRKLAEEILALNQMLRGQVQNGFFVGQSDVQEVRQFPAQRSVAGNDCSMRPSRSGESTADTEDMRKKVPEKLPLVKTY
jgi:hypothetical protein